jgi:hypothetical protein
MGQATGLMSETVADEAPARRRKKRQGSETRNMCGRLVVRYDQEKLQALEAAAGRQLPSLIRECGDLLTELLPVADERGLDPVDLLRETARALAAAS